MDEMRSAVKNGNLKLIFEMLALDVDYGMRILCISVGEKRLDMARVILKSGKVHKYDIQYCLIYKAIPSFDKEAFDLLTEFGGDINSTWSYSVFDYFYISNTYKLIKFAIDNGLDTNLYTYIPRKSLLQVSVHRNNIAVTQLLVDHPKTDIYKCGNDFYNKSFRIVTRERNFRSVECLHSILVVDLRRLLLSMLNGAQVRVDSKRARLWEN